MVLPSVSLKHEGIDENACAPQGKYREAEPLYLRCVNIKEKTLGSDHPYVAASLSCLAGVLEKQARVVIFPLVCIDCCSLA